MARPSNAAREAEAPGERAGRLVSGLSPHRLLFRLFHDEGVRVFDTHPVEARCRCSRERIGRILRSFPVEDIEEMRQDEVTTVTCEFCNTRYEFAGEDFAPLASA